MIVDRDCLFRNLTEFTWKGSPTPFEERVTLLDQAVDEAVSQVWRDLPEKHLHLALSGGVDSCTLLLKALPHGPVTTHTLGVGETHPDILYARLILTHLEGVRCLEHLDPVSPRDVQVSNSILGTTAQKPDMYLLLMEAIRPYTKDVVCGDLIDELLGGYYQHQQGTLEVFQGLFDNLVPNHLEPLDQISTALGIRVHLPYGRLGVLQACSLFSPEELAGPGFRKKPLSEVAFRCGVPSDIILRRKRGLVSAKDVC